MIPKLTPDQIANLVPILRNPYKGWTACIADAIAAYEAIRPKEDASQLQRTNHALAAELAAVKKDCALAESHYERVERELAATKSELNARLHERTQAFLTKETAHLLGWASTKDELKEARRLIANLLARLHEAQSAAPEPKPTPEEIEEKEIKTAFLFAGHETQSLESFTAGWKAARAAKGGSAV